MRGRSRRGEARRRQIYPSGDRPGQDGSPSRGAGAAVSSGHAPRGRHRQHEHHDRPVPERAARRRAGAPGPSPGRPTTSSRCCSTGCSGSTPPSSATSSAIACASVVPGPDRRAGRTVAGPARAAAPGGRRRPRPDRDPGRPTGRGRRRPAGQRAGRGPAVRDPGGGRRLRDRDDVRRGGRRRGVRRRGDRAGSRARPRGARRRGPRSCPGSSCARPTGRSAGTPSSAMQSGAILGYQALVAGMLARIRAELAEAERRRRRATSGRS